MSSNQSTQTFLASLDSSDLEAIEEIFYRMRGKSFVDKIEFGVLLTQALTKGSLADYHQLFDMVDISRDGLINWDRFSNYLLLEYYEREDHIKTTQVPQWQDIKNIPSSHKNAICSILQNSTSSGFRYCTVSKDGLVSTFNEQHEVKRTSQIHTNPEEIRSKDLWVTEAALMPNVNKIAFATTSREIWIYDISSNNDFVCQYKIVGMRFIPLCINYWSNKNNSNVALLSFGDTGGFAHAIFFKAATSSLFDKPWKSEQSQETCFQVHINNILNGKYPSASCIHYKAHSAWVRQIMFVPLLDCFLTCSTTSTDSIVLAWIGKSQKDVRLTEFKIPLGINGFDYQESLNLIASAGINNHVCLWNPYVVSKPIGVLRGHMQVIVAVQFIRSKYQLVSLSKDKVLRIWDVNLQICIQRLTGILPKGPDVSVLMHYDQEAAALFSTYNYHLQVLKMKREVKHRVVSHDSTVTEAIYNEKYGHVISVDESSCITIWFLNTGQKVKQISEAHGEAEITTVCLDHTQTRILTAGTDGAIKVWDINGNCYHVLVVEDGNPCEITQILYLKRMIVAIGWSRILCFFTSAQLKSYYVQPSQWKGKQQHFDDILSADFLEPRTLVTASYDGDIVFWNTNTQNSVRKITSQRKSRLGGKRLPPLSPRKSRQERRDIDFSVENNITSSVTSNFLQPSHQQSSLGASPSPLDGISSPSTSAAVTITSIAYLKQRNGNNPRTADLYSCHSDGLVRFWNSTTCDNLGQFTVYEQFGSMVSCTNSSDELLCVGGENGACKIFYIDDFLNDKKRDIISPPTQLSTENTFPELLLTFTTHTDAVTSVRWIERSGKILLLTASTDCSVAIHSLDALIGIFGQNEHWNINDIPSTQLMEWVEMRRSVIANETYLAECSEDDGEEEEELQNEELLHEHNTVTMSVPSSPSFEHQQQHVSEVSLTEKHRKEDVTFWDQPEIKELVKEANSSKHLIANLKKARVLRIDNSHMSSSSNDDDSSSFGNNKRNAVCSYRLLSTKQIEVVGELKKPEFVLHPERYFLEKDENERNNNSSNITTFLDHEQPATDLDEWADDLKLRHDEKSIFPKHILEMDLKMRTAHKLMLNKQPTRSNLRSRAKSVLKQL